MIGNPIKTMIEMKKDTIPVTMSYGNGTMSQPHFAILPAILTAVPNPPKK